MATVPAFPQLPAGACRTCGVAARVGAVRAAVGRVHCALLLLALRCHRSDGGSAVVEYVGLALVVSMLMTALASAIDSAMGERLARALITRLIESVDDGSGAG